MIYGIVVRTPFRKEAFSMKDISFGGNNMRKQDIINVAVIAHVDAGKSWIVMT